MKLTLPESDNSKIDLSDFVVQTVNKIEFAPLSLDDENDKMEVVGTTKLFRCVDSIARIIEEEEIILIDELQSCEESEHSDQIIQKILEEDEDKQESQLQKITSKIKSKKHLISEQSLNQFKD